MTKAFLKDAFLWGGALWFLGYVLGFLFFAFVPASLIGWFIMPFGIAATMWVLMTHINNGTLSYYLKIGVIWTVLAITLDYVFLVRLLNPADGYYKPDVYLYYVLTFLLPITVYMFKSR